MKILNGSNFPETSSVILPSPFAYVLSLSLFQKKKKKKRGNILTVASIRYIRLFSSARKTSSPDYELHAQRQRRKHFIGLEKLDRRQHAGSLPIPVVLAPRRLCVTSSILPLSTSYVPFDLESVRKARLPAFH